MAFVFLNTSGGPELDVSDTKRMRAHVTRTNFAKRRQRLLQRNTKRTTTPQVNGRQSSRAKALPSIPPLASPPIEPCQLAQYLSDFWSKMFVHGRRFPDTPEEEGFIRLHVSEPALREIALAIGIRYWSPDTSHQAAAHVSKSVDAVIQRIQSGKADAVIGAVLTHAFQERLLHNQHSWTVHINGLANIVSEIHTAGSSEVPRLLYDFLILDSTNFAFGFPLACDRNLIEAIDPLETTPLGKIGSCSEAVAALLRRIEDFYNGGAPSKVSATVISEMWSSLLDRIYDSEASNKSDDPYIQTACLALQLALRLAWPPDTQMDLTVLAAELKEARCRLPVRPCMLLDMTSSQLLLGAIASDLDSSTRMWFVNKLTAAAHHLRARGWQQPLRILEQALPSDTFLVRRFKVLCSELTL